MRTVLEIKLKPTKRATVIPMVANPMTMKGNCVLGDEEGTVKCQAEHKGKMKTVICEKDDDVIAAKDNADWDKIDNETRFLKPMTKLSDGKTNTNHVSETSKNASRSHGRIL